MHGPFRLAMALGLMTLSACGTDRVSAPQPPGRSTCPAVEVVLPAYPYADTDLTEVAPGFLNRLAADYACSLAPGITPNPVEFLYGYAPLRLFDDVQQHGPVDLERMLWVLHVSGYFGGMWLKANLLQFNGVPGTQPVNTTGDGGLVTAARSAREAVDAAAAGGATLRAFNDSSLVAGLFPRLGIASNFGYNKGYLLQIYDQPPTGLTSPPDFVRCAGTLWCDYRSTHLAVLPGLKTVSDALAGSADPYAALGRRVQPVQASAEALGRNVWGTFLDYSGMPQDFYEDLLRVSATFLEVVQATALLSAKAVAEGDEAAGRDAAYMQSGLIVWLSAYMGAFTATPPPDTPLPELRVVTGR